MAKLFSVLFVTLCFLLRRQVDGQTSLSPSPVARVVAGLCPQGRYGEECEYRCHCPVGTECDPNTGHCPGDCAPGWAGKPFCQSENVALRKDTYQHGTYLGWDSSRAVDGNTDQDVMHGSCAWAHNKHDVFHTWWHVDLGEARHIQSIEIYFRTDDERSESRRAGIRVYISGTREEAKNEGLCYMDTLIDFTFPAAHLTLRDGSFTCSQRTGRYVIMYMNRPTQTPVVGNCPANTSYSCWANLELCEVQVFSCPNGTYGDLCQNKCHCQNNVSCDATSGQCPSVCQPGWEGTKCDTKCEIGRYGWDCQSICGHCHNNEPCNHVTGSCPNGCGTGWKGSTCEDGTKYHILERNFTMNEAPDHCQLATPALNYTRYGNIQLNLTTDMLHPDEGEKFWLGYVKVFQAFQYRGCVPTSVIVPHVTHSLGTFPSSTAPGDCASFCGTAIGHMIGLSGFKCYCLPSFNQSNDSLTSFGCTHFCFHTGALCGSLGGRFLSIYERVEYRPSIANLTDDVHDLCLAWNADLVEYAWSKCYANHRYVCQQDESDNTIESRSIFNSWTTIMQWCLKDGSEPASRKSLSDLVKIRWEPNTTLWIGEVRDLVITPDNSKAVAVHRGYAVLHGGVFYVGFGDDTEQHDALCQKERTIRSTTSVSTTSVTVNNATTPPTHPDSTQTESTTYVSTEAVDATINNATKPTTNADSTQTVTMYILYVIIALVLAANISVGVICVIRWKMRKISHGGSTNQPENVNAVRLDEHVGDSTLLASSHQNRSSSRATNLEMGRMRLVELNDGVDDTDNESPDDEPQQEGGGYEHAYSGLDRHRNDAGNEHTYAPMEVEPGPEGDSYVHMYSGLNRQRDDADNEHTYSPMLVEHEPDGDSYVHMYSVLNRQRVGSSTEHAYSAIHVQPQLEDTTPEYLNLSLLG